MTDRKFSFLFLGIINLFTIAITVLTYFAGSAEGLAVMIPTVLLVSIVTLTELAT